MHPILVIDLEATCADDGSIGPEDMEIIEVGAVWSKADGFIVDEFQEFVRPALRPKLTQFCRGLTGIAQADIDSAESWSTISGKLLNFSSLYTEARWVSWGNYDANQIVRECVRHQVDNPLATMQHQNIKKSFARARKIKQVGMSTALQIVGLVAEGSHHRALDDARNIAKLLPWCQINSAG